MFMIATDQNSSSLSWREQIRFHASKWSLNAVLTANRFALFVQKKWMCSLKLSTVGSTANFFITSSAHVARVLVPLDCFNTWALSLLYITLAGLSRLIMSSTLVEIKPRITPAVTSFAAFNFSSSAQYSLISLLVGVATAATAVPCEVPAVVVEPAGAEAGACCTV